MAVLGADSIILEPDLRVPQHQALADYDGDGNIDLTLSLGDGDGTFQPLTYYLKPVPLSSLGGAAIVSRDFNSDSKPDIALAVGVASIALNVLINSTGTPPPPAPVTVSSVTLSPSTVTLSASVQTEKTVQLSSSLAAATVPASVTVAAGASTANFTVNTSQVSATTTAVDDSAGSSVCPSIRKPSPCAATLVDRQLVRSGSNNHLTRKRGGKATFRHSTGYCLPARSSILDQPNQQNRAGILLWSVTLCGPDRVRVRDA